MLRSCIINNVIVLLNFRTNQNGVVDTMEVRISQGNYSHYVFYKINSLKRLWEIEKAYNKE
jgi:hypothetical protein